MGTHIATLDDSVKTLFYRGEHAGKDALSTLVKRASDERNDTGFKLRGVNHVETRGSSLDLSLASAPWADPRGHGGLHQRAAGAFLRRWPGEETRPRWASGTSQVVLTSPMRHA